MLEIFKKLNELKKNEENADFLKNIAEFFKKSNYGR